jgi:hypothetical protein
MAESAPLLADEVLPERPQDWERETAFLQRQDWRIVVDPLLFPSTDRS